MPLDGSDIYKYRRQRRLGDKIHVIGYPKSGNHLMVQLLNGLTYFTERQVIHAHTPTECDVHILRHPIAVACSQIRPKLEAAEHLGAKLKMLEDQCDMMCTRTEVRLPWRAYVNVMLVLAETTIRYEQLLEDPVGQLARINGIDEDLATKLVERHDERFSKASAEEKKRGWSFNKGKAYDFREWVPPDDERALMLRFFPESIYI